MRSLRAAINSVWFALAGCLTFASLGLAAEVVGPHRFPFPVEIDAKAGKTGEYPNRVKDKRSGTWLVFVPGGKYKIGTDKRPDSKPIEVTMSGFYISQAQVGGEAFAKAYLAEWERELASLAEDVAQDEELNLPKKLTPADTADLLLMICYPCFALSPPWSSQFLGGPSGWDISIDSLGFGAAEEKKLEELMADQAKRLDDGKPALPLTPAERKGLQKIEAALRRYIRKAGTDQKSAVRRVSYKGAKGYAESQGLNLPTEAQWEVAANLANAKRLNMDGMFDEVLEWCADYYVYSYYRRKKNFTDPTGPSRGGLNSKQSTRLSGSSVLFSSARARRVRVVRGRDASARDFPLPGNHTAYIPANDDRSDMGFRVVYNPKAGREE